MCLNLEVHHLRCQIRIEEGLLLYIGAVANKRAIVFGVVMPNRHLSIVVIGFGLEVGELKGLIDT